MRTYDSFIAIFAPAGSDYDLLQDVGDGRTMWEVVRDRLFDAKPHERSEFGEQVMRAIWTCMYDDEFVIGRLLSVHIFDDRGYARPLPHIVLDIARRIQKCDPQRAHHAMRRILGSDNLSDRFIGAVATAYLHFEDAA